MSDIDLSSLESNIKTESKNYTDIEDVYDIELFTKESNIFTSIDESKLFKGTNRKNEMDTSILFAKVEETDNNTINNQSTIGIDFSIVIIAIVMISLIILLFRRFNKNEYSY